jgi:two-component system KDP operon response regulator KdpE
MSGASILAIEDDPQARRFLRPTLGAHGYVVTEVGTIAAASDAIRRLKPAVVLLDRGLPDGDGLSVLRAMPEDARPAVIVLSARGQEGDKLAALDARAEDYLTKPFGASELLALARRPGRVVTHRQLGPTVIP